MLYIVKILTLIAGCLKAIAAGILGCKDSLVDFMIDRNFKAHDKIDVKLAGVREITNAKVDNAYIVYKDTLAKAGLAESRTRDAMQDKSAKLNEKLVTLCNAKE